MDMVSRDASLIATTIRIQVRFKGIQEDKLAKVSASRIKAFSSLKSI